MSDICLIADGSFREYILRAAGPQEKLPTIGDAVYFYPTLDWHDKIERALPPNLRLGNMYTITPTEAFAYVYQANRYTVLDAYPKSARKLTRSLTRLDISPEGWIVSRNTLDRQPTIPQSDLASALELFRCEIDDPYTGLCLVLDREATQALEFASKAVFEPPRNVTNIAAVRINVIRAKG